MNTVPTARSRTPLRQYLFDLTLHGIKLGLDNIQALVRAADDPHLAYPTVHVGGTNGKGSVVAMLAAMLSAAGYRVGRFTSPHLIDVSERFLINGEAIPESALEENIQFFREIAEGMAQCPTFFEMNTAIAFRYFAQEKVDIALIEVGMGGRFDSTNVVQPLVTAITNIDLDHTAFLGDTIKAIATEKAGIIKQGVPLVTTETQSEALGVFHLRAAEADAPVLQVMKDFDFRLEGAPWEQRLTYVSAERSLVDVPLGLAGSCQGANAAVAVALAGELVSAFPELTQEHMETGLAKVAWPCRLEKVLDDPPVIIDVAHNRAGTERLAELFDECVVVFAASSDKDAEGMLAALRPKARHLILTQFEGKRATPVEELATDLEPGSYHRDERLGDAILRGLALASAECPLLITGSIYAAGEARQYLIEEHGATPLTF
ncbi:MAG: bifunctional folylpolyglutamate synthase/dihydrofolate synthase [Candidatus Hydrogenedentes bacterium]|nr:bifunctional folylpolyglutamate synthase/dihydrofolate synthase [Candidatus Hydrogenedentota bacterium]